MPFDLPHILVILLILLGLIVFGIRFGMRVFCVETNAYFPLLCRSNHWGNRRVVSLTFDDGVDPIQTPKILSILDESGIKAAFFLIGERAEKYPEIVRQIHAKGHLIGNHSYSHRPRFPMQQTQSMINELIKTNTILKALTGEDVKYFRPPFGVKNPMVGKAVKTLNLTGIGWSVRSLDTLNRSFAWVLNRIKKKLHPGAIILLHDTRKDSDLLLRHLLKMLAEESYEVKDLEELLNQ